MTMTKEAETFEHRCAQCGRTHATPSPSVLPFGWKRSSAGRKGPKMIFCGNLCVEARRCGVEPVA